MAEAQISTSAERAGGRRLVSGILWNGLGRGLPLLLALVITPFLVGALGIERWGLFTLALALIGIFGIFDLGLGMALTRGVSEKLGTGAVEEARAMIGATLFALLGVSAWMAVALFLFVPFLVGRFLNVPDALQQEAVIAFQVLAAGAPLVVLNAALWGVLAAWQRFRLANLVNIPLNTFYYLGPLLVLFVWDSLIGVMLAVLLVRLLSGSAYAIIAHRDVPGLGLRDARFALLRPLLRQGFWMSSSGALTQLLLYADRFIIGAMLTLSAVAFYATPLDLIIRLWIIPVAVVQTLLPAIASSFRDLPESTALLIKRGALIVTLLALPASLVLIPGAELFLRLWLGETFATGGGKVLRILAFGIFFSCLSFIPGVLLEAIGRPDVTAKFSLLLGVIFLPLSIVLLLWIGIEGAALAWAARCLVDCLGRCWLAARLYPAVRDTMRELLWPIAPATLGLAVLVPLGGVAWPAILALAIFGLVFAAGWSIAAPQDKAHALGMIRRIGRRSA
ncbi:MAG: flippase [Roseomonas sp.]|nr:flippase [Roseomonas sp.]MCA3296622.1 flippase [Roseomonas sp.]